MRILLRKTWNHNIGNGFLGKGALATLERAFPDADIVELGHYGRFANQQRYSLSRRIAARFGQGLEKDEENRMKFFSSVDPDLVVLPGPILDETAYQTFEPTLRQAYEDDVPIFLLGTGSPSYAQNTQTYIHSMFDKYPPDAILTRNPIAYELYSDLVPRAHDGIDNAFYIDEWFDPVRIEKPFTAITFDKTDERPIDAAGEVIRPQHRPYRPYILSISDRIKRKLSLGWSMVRYDDPNWFFSDSLEDYLFVYANSETTYTDRIHAAVPTMVYGNRARLYLDSSRTKIFEKEFVERKGGYLTVDRPKLEEAKDEQIRTLREYWDDVSN